MSNPRVYLGIITSSMKTIGVDFPKPIATALAERTRLSQSARNYNIPTSEAVADAMYSAVLAGRDPLDDDDVRRMAVVVTFAGSGDGIVMRVAEAADRRVTDAMTSNAADLLAVLHAAADNAGATLAAAHRILGDTEMGDSNAVLHLGVDATSAWVDARAAVKVLNAIDTAWVMLANLTNLTSATPPPPLRMADTPLDVYKKVPYRCTAWEVVKAGGTIDLASFDNINARVARLNAEREHRTANAPTFADAYRQHSGIVVSG